MVLLMKMIIIVTTKCFWKNVHMNNINIAYYDEIDISEGIDVNKTSASKECIICHYCYFLDKGFNFHLNVCNKCHDVLMSMNLNDIAILNIDSVDYTYIITGISKCEAINL